MMQVEHQAVEEEMIMTKIEVIVDAEEIEEDVIEKDMTIIDTMMIEEIVRNVVTTQVAMTEEIDAKVI